MDGMRRLMGRRALVTGSATGIGRATVQRLTAEGATAVVNYVGPSDPADEAGEEIAGAGGEAGACHAGVSSQEQVQAMLARAAEQLGGPIDLLVNNAGVE